ncbi:MAG: lipoprotein-releasing system transmembrane subunit LolC [Candidatus Rokuibacteriota bacterium]|nr:MAG: lipoprotein-releasing system transmembrane subunit LolC [Candidatus Rokubacteria bacterium]
MKRGLPYELFLGFRYLGSRGNRANLSLFAWIGVGSVFLGVAALILVVAVMTGFQDGIRDRIISASPHLLVFQSGAAGMSNPDQVAASVRQVPGIRAATPFVLQQALITSPGGDAHGGLVRGVDTSDPSVMADLRAQLRSGRLEAIGENEGGILLGAELARLLGVLPGDAVTVISPKGALTAVGMVPKMRRYTVTGTVQVGMHEYDSSIAYLSLTAARDFAGLPGVTGIEVKLADPFAAGEIGRAVSRRLGYSYWVRDWRDMNRNLFNALQLEKLALFLILTIISLVAAFAILGHLVLLVADKRKEIGILKSIGATRRSITAVFFTVGIGIYVVGTLAGSAVGFALIWVQNTYKIIRLAGDVYQIDYLPMRLAVPDFLWILIVTGGLSIVATIVPARRAGRLNPVDVLRYE